MIESGLKFAILNTATWDRTIKTCYYHRKTDNVVYLISFFADGHSATGSFENGDTDLYEFSSNVQQESRIYILSEGYEEISKEEFMKIVDERYPGWREQPDELYD